MDEQNEVTMRLPWHKLSNELRRRLIICMRGMVPDFVADARDLNHAWDAAADTLESISRESVSKKAAFEPGAAVQLKGGSPAMTADLADDLDMADCYWIASGGLHNELIPVSCLEHIEPALRAAELRAEARRLTEELGYEQIAEAVSFAISEHGRAVRLYRELCKLVDEDPDREVDEQVLLNRLAAKLEEGAQSYQALTAEQAELLRSWRAYFDNESGDVVEALVNVLKLRLWGREIKEPTLKALAERDSNICADTIALLEELVAAPEGG